MPCKDSDQTLNVQADFSLHWVHMQSCRKYCALAQITWKGILFGMPSKHTTLQQLRRVFAGWQFSSIFISRHTIVAGYYGFMLVVRESVRPSYVRPSVRFSFPDDNLSKHHWIGTKLFMCIDIKEIWFGIANGQISSIFDGVICPRHAHIFVSRL